MIPSKKALATIESNVVQVNQLKQTNSKAANEKARKEVMLSLEKIMDSTNKNGVLIKRTLDEIKKENEPFMKEESAKKPK